MTKNIWDFSAFPPCARPCMYNQAPLHCDDDDFGCQCTDKKYLSVWTTCVMNTCLQREQRVSWRVNVQGCSTVGFNVEQLMPVGFAGWSSPPSNFLTTSDPAPNLKHQTGSAGFQTIPRSVVASTEAARNNKPSASPALSRQTTASTISSSPTSESAIVNMSSTPIKPFASTAPGQSAYTSTAQKNSPESSSSPSSESSGVPTGAIVGLVVGIIALFSIIGAVFFLLRRRRQQKDADSLDDHSWLPVSSPTSTRSPTAPGSRSGSAAGVGIGRLALESEMPAVEKPQSAYKERKRASRASIDRQQEMRHSHYYNSQRSEMPLPKNNNQGWRGDNAL